MSPSVELESLMIPEEPNKAVARVTVYVSLIGQLLYVSDQHDATNQYESTY